MTNKYRNQPTYVDDIRFASKKEAKRYRELKLLKRAGVIENLRLQVKFELQPSFKINQKTINPIYYVADFVYDEKGFIIVEDTKGFRTKEYLLKKKMFAYKNGYEITEV
jgi:hypothetical protein